ncbi:ribonuclease Z [Flavobacterium sp. AS60]|uniref:ribonuclease Z n=1 Tax=Flavobacterium anseongense TaxID=2910677 RepID=UPI001F3596E0|nr:ribonuclease Z [Flavobacterium sp. AS60]MCF6129432.1 ribonuclease Z [Flavobacterium sp. AS60]
MKVEQKGHTTIIRNTQGNTAEFYQKLHHEYNSFKSQNLIVDLSHDKALTMDDIKLFSDLSKTHTKAKKSFVLVSNNVNFNAVPKNITLVPTILEAHDIIEMDEIERDLGF